MGLALVYNGQSSQELFSIDIQGFFQGFVLHKGGGGGSGEGPKTTINPWWGIYQLFHSFLHLEITSVTSIHGTSIRL